MGYYPGIDYATSPFVPSCRVVGADPCTVVNVGPRSRPRQQMLVSISIFSHSQYLVLDDNLLPRSACVCFSVFTQFQMPILICSRWSSPSRSRSRSISSRSGVPLCTRYLCTLLCCLYPRLSSVLSLSLPLPPGTFLGPIIGTVQWMFKCFVAGLTRTPGATGEGQGDEEGGRKDHFFRGR